MLQQTGDNTIMVSFLGKEHCFPSDIDEYWECRELSIQMRESLSREITMALVEADDKFISEDNLLQMFEKRATVFIQKLCDKGIYAVTASEFVLNSKGYLDIQKTDTEYRIFRARLENDTQTEFELLKKEARINADATITGSGVSVISNSVTDLAIGSFVDNMATNSQTRKANQQYLETICNMRSLIDNKKENKISEYIDDTYIPAMISAVWRFTDDILNNYLSSLQTEGKFAPETIKFTNLERSKALLDNLELTDNKSTIIEMAFLACPFNEQVYIECAKSNLMGAAEVETAKRFQQYDKLHAYLKHALATFESTGNFCDDNEALSKIVMPLSICTGTDAQKYRKHFFKSICNVVSGQYGRIFDDIFLEALCADMIRKLGDNVLSMNDKACSLMAHNYIGAIVTDENFQFLAELYGNDLMFDKDTCLKKQDLGLKTKNELDAYCIKRLNERLCTLIEKRKKIIMDERTKLEIERVKREELYQKIHKRIIVIGIMICIFPLLIRAPFVYMWQRHAERFAAEWVEYNYNKKISKADSSINKAQIIGYEIEKYSYYKNDSSVYIVPRLKLYSEAKCADISRYGAENCVWELCNTLSWGDDSPEHMSVSLLIGDPNDTLSLSGIATVVTSDGTNINISTTTVLNLKRTSIYMPFGFLLFYMFFLSITICSCKYVVKNKRKQLLIQQS